MQEIVARDEPILREEMPVAQAKAIFEAMGYDDKVRLLRFREEPTIAVYRLRGVYNYFYGYMMPSTGALSGFWLELYPPGFILRVPQMGFPLPLHSHHDYPKLMDVFREYGEWLSILGIEDIGSLNEAVENGRIRQAVLVSEALHEKQIARIADEIAHRRPRVRVVLVAGPSSSGKTTFVRGLARGLGITEPVRSPTFTLTHEYTIQQPPGLRGLPLFHIDLYRIETAAQLHTLGLDEVFERGGVAAIEWAERLELWGESLPVAHLWAVRLIPTGDAERRIVIECLQKPPACADTTP